MDNHLHVLCRLDPSDAEAWSDEDVVRRWIAVYPPRTLAMDDPDVLQKWIAHEAKDTKRVALLRQRLADLGWFMKALKEPLARLANKADGTRGTFWEARYKSVAILDTEALLATCAYIDLNPVAAGIAETPEASRHTSVRQRVEHAKAKGQIDSLKAARLGSVAGGNSIGNLEQDHWLVPIEDRRVRNATDNKVSASRRKSEEVREGMLETFSLGSYLLLVEYTGRLWRNGKANLNAGLKEIFDRIDSSAELLSERIQRMMQANSLRGSFFASTKESLQEFATNRGKRTANLSPQVA
ncbi:MAG: hypothetical protein R3C28_16005 [Pirellulaceae bacterium]